MKKWYATTAGNWGLRAGGFLLILIGSLIAMRLHHLGPTASARDAHMVQILLAAGLFLCGSAGSALLFVGPGLWEKVEVSERWRRPHG